MVFNRAPRWIRALLLRRRIEREMHQEMAAHLDKSTERLMSRGLTASDARRAALREFGNVAHLQEQARDARGTGWVDALVADSRFAARHFWRKPGTTLTMFVVLVAGLVISTLLFTYVHAYAFRPPPGITLEDDLVRIRGSRDAGLGGRGYRTFSEEELLEYRKLHAVFAGVAGWSDAVVAMSGGGAAQAAGLEARATFVTENYFPVLGVRPVLGAGLPTVGADDVSASAVTVIGHAVWEQFFAKSPSAIGSTIVANGVAFTIVGVAPEKFVSFPGQARFQLWMPLAARRLFTTQPTGEFRAVARLRDGVTLGTASAAVRSVATRTAERYAEVKALDPSADVVPLYSANSDPMAERDVRIMAVAVGALATLVLLVTCTNVSALLTGLATARRQEIAIRLSLGAARARLVRQLLTESALLGVAAGAAALACVWGVLRVIEKSVPWMPFEVTVTWPTLTFTFGTALAVGVLFGLSPALHATRLGLASALRDSAGTVAASRGRLQRGLVVAQIAFTQPLIVLLAAVLLLVLGQFLPRTRPQFADRLITASFRTSAPITGVSAAAAQSRQAARTAMYRLRDRIASVAGVESAVITWGSAWSLGSYVVHPDDRVSGVSQNAFGVLGEQAAKGYLPAMGVPLVRGREFIPGELSSVATRRAEAPAIIGADLARRLWPGVDPIGRRLAATSDSTVGARTLVVVGVIDDPAANTRKPGDDYRLYLPPDTTLAPRALLIRTTALASSVVPALRDVIQAEAPDMPARIQTLAEVEDGHQRRFRMVTAALVAAGIAAMLLSAIGLYAVVAFSVGQRTREIAVRIAVGARGQQIVQRFVGDGLRLSGIGLALGLPVSLVGLAVLMTAVPDIPAVPLPWVTTIAAVGVVLVAAIAAWLPARRAAAVDPAVALRSE